MWAYWLLFLLPAGIAFSPIRGDKYVQQLTWAMVGLLGILLIGLRYKVGGDWMPYIEYLQEAHMAVQVGGLEEIIAGSSLVNGSLYIFLNWVAIRLGFGMDMGIYFVNLFCAVIFVTGLIRFCQKQPMPWLALAVAVPYLVCVVAMGYTRQATALGFLLWGLSILKAGNEHKFIGLVFLGSLFHISLVVTLPLVMFAREKILWWFYPFIGCFFIGLYFWVTTLGLLDLYETVLEFYIGSHSAGGEIRAYMNALPVFVALFFRAKIKAISFDYKIIKWMAIAALISIPMLSVSTTLIDRFALYLIPLQIALWPRIIAVQRTMVMRSAFASMIIVYYSLVLFVFFNFGLHSSWWVPYQMWPFTSETIYPLLSPM